MITQDKIPEPDNCLWCQEARNCTTAAFHSQMLLDPKIPPDVGMQEYLSKLCDCGHQTIPSFAEGTDIPDFIPHTKLCIEHTLQWMETITNLKIKYDKQ